MRARGVAGSVARLGLSDHVAWIYGSDDEFAEFRLAALQFSADALDLGQRLMYVTDRAEDEVLHDLRTLGDVQDLKGRGALAVQGVLDTYPTGGPVVDHDALITGFAGAVDQALDTGFAGVRVISECSALASDPAWCTDHARWEMVADRYMARPRPLAALCGYDSRVVGPDTAAVLASVHPVRNDDTTTFAVFSDRDTVCVDGELDAFQATALTQALAAVPRRDPLVLDLAGLTFADTAGVAILGKQITTWAEGGAEVRVCNLRPLQRRMWQLLGFSEDAVRFA